MNPIQPAEVKTAFDAYPPRLRARLLELRALIFATAAKTDGAGELDETLKWGEPAYLTARTRSGSTIRIGRRKDDPDKYCMYFNCQTRLVETFRQWFPERLTFEGNRAVVFDVAEPLPRADVTECIAAALTYHRDKRRRPTR